MFYNISCASLVRHVQLDLVLLVYHMTTIVVFSLLLNHSSYGKAAPDI